MSRRAIATHRLYNQRLAEWNAATVDELVQWMGAVQAQDYTGAKWGIGQRVDAATDDAIDALLDEGVIVRTHLLRPTWHIVHAVDVRWMLALSAPRIRMMDAARLRQIELDDTTLRRCHELIADGLRDGGYRTRNEISALLAGAGVAMRDNRLAHILMHAELDALICSGPMRGRQQTSALLEERVPHSPERDRDDALGEIVRRYFRSHGPATVHDCAWWAGLVIKDVRRGIEVAGNALTHRTIEDVVYWTGADSEPPARSKPMLHLLPNFDEHTVAYRDHSPSLDPSIAWTSNVFFDRLAPHVIAVDGLAIGGWRRVVDKHGVTVELYPQRALSGAERQRLAGALAAMQTFLGAPVRAVDAS